MKLSKRLKWLFRLVQVQKVVRSLVRGLWISGAVYILCWGLDGFTGWMSNPDLWLLISAAAGILSLLSLMWKPVRFTNFLWRVDRKLELKEQISTAYEVSERSNLDQNEVDAALLREAAALISELFRRVLNKGWRIRNDLEALLVVGLLLVVVNLSGLDLFGSSLPGIKLSLLPGLGSDPGFLDVFPSGLPGPAPAAPAAARQSEDIVFENLDNFTPEEKRKINETLQQLGFALLENSATIDLGEPLTSGNYTIAADQLDIVNEQIHRISETTQQEIAFQFNEVVRKLFRAKYQAITNVFFDAAEALENGNIKRINISLGALSNLLRNLERFGINQALVDLPQPEADDIQTSRLAGEGEALAAESAEDVSDLLAVPGGGSASSLRVLGKAVDTEGVNFNSAGGSDLPTYTYSWDANDVVSSYFSPR